MSDPIFLPYSPLIETMNDDEIILWLYQEKIVIKKYNVPNYQWEEIEKLYKQNKSHVRNNSK